MAWPTSLSIALKEWASALRALDDGRQIVLLRKGGILEAAGGFEVEHREFLLFPTYVHQKRPMLKVAEQALIEERDDEPANLVISAAAVVSDVVRVKSRAQMDAIDDEHIWSGAMIDMRFNYRPMNPLYLLLLRVHRLHEPVTLANTPAYAGCKSWVPLEQEIATGNSLPVLDDVKYDVRRRGILERVAGV